MEATQRRQPLHINDQAELDCYVATSFQRQVRRGKGWSLPSGYTKDRQLSNGTNNNVMTIRPTTTSTSSTSTKKDILVYRYPRSESDTREYEQALAEFECTVLAAARGVAPAVYDAWFAKSERCKRGLHMVLERFDDELFELMYEKPHKMIELAPRIGKLIAHHIRALASMDAMHYDLKSTNIVYRTSPELDVRIIDFGQDFCERRAYAEPDKKGTPALNRIVALCANEKEYRETLELAMLVVLSAHLTHEIEKNKIPINMPSIDRERIHPLLHIVRKARTTATPRQVRLLRRALRVEDIRTHAAYYNGRRESGTRRLFRRSGFAASRPRTRANEANESKIMLID